MSESSPPAFAGNALIRTPEGLTPEAIEAVLADFRAWLQQLPAPVEVPVDGTPPLATSASESAPPIDLHTLLGQFIALRHEVNLQTKAVRTQQEQNAKTLEQLTEALESLHQVQEEREEALLDAQDERVRPLLKTLVDLTDALGLARREIQRAQTTIASYLDQLPSLFEETPASGFSTPTVDPSIPNRRGFWARWFGKGGVETAMPSPVPPGQSERRKQVTDMAEQIRLLLESLITGYRMSLQRTERALEQHGLERMACAGQPFDPERMEVVEAVDASGRTPGEVVDDVRAGYLWRGKVFRYAQVRVARS
jgi:molecular chaperone GrpE